MKKKKCKPCAYASKHGHWGKSIPVNNTHCRVCHATWSGYASAHCLKCHRTFGGNSVADRYDLSIKSGCISDKKLRKAGLVVTDDHRGVVWRTVMTEDAQARLDAIKT